MQTNNTAVAQLLREIAAALTIKKTGNQFEIRAYETAADSIEHFTSEAKDLWEEGKLDVVPGLGKKLRGYLDELFRTGQVKHFESVKADIPPAIFEFLDISGVGPKTAQELAKLKVKNINDLKNKIKSGELVKDGFSSKVAEKIIQAIEKLPGKNSGRMLLPYASVQAERIISYLKKEPVVLEAHPLGSLRRMVATIGDLDFSVATKEPKKVIQHFVKMPTVKRIVEQGDSGASVILNSGIRVDLLVGSPESYGALLQHFTGGKNHNIHLRTLAIGKGLSLSEYGVKKANQVSQPIIPTRTEEEFYKLLGMETPPPEIREDTGEIEVAIEHKLPKLIDFKDIKGDLHIHTNFPFSNPSHGPGANSVEDMVKKARDLGYSFIGISDHPPGHGMISQAGMVKAIEKRTKFIQQVQKKTKGIRVLNGLEIDILPNGAMSVPDEALKTLDYCIAGIHSGHRGSKEKITMRLLAALNNPYVDIISHPTNRLLNERDSSEADWEEVFKTAAKNKKVLEINSYPNRLDLRDDLVRLAKHYGVKFVIDSDAHAVDQMEMMPYGVSVARRGWAEKEDIVNSWDWEKFAKWFGLK